MEEETTVTALSLWRDEIVSGLSLRFYFHWAQSLRALVAWMMCPDGTRNENCGSNPDHFKFLLQF
jgi:hypothetical protein